MEKSLFTQVREAGTPMATKADLVAYFKHESPRNWQSKLTEALFPFTTAKNTHNLARRFNSGAKGGENRLDRPGSKKEQQEYKALGEMLPPKPPEGGYHIEGEVYIKFSDGECEPREVSEDITGEDAEALAAMAAQEMIDALTNLYMSEGASMETPEEPFYSPGGCQEPDITVTAIED